MDSKKLRRQQNTTASSAALFSVWKGPLGSAAFYADAVRHVNRFTLAFALHFPALEGLRSTRSLASFLCNVFYTLFTPLLYHNYAGGANAS